MVCTCVALCVGHVGVCMCVYMCDTVCIQAVQVCMCVYVYKYCSSMCGLCACQQFRVHVVIKVLLGTHKIFKQNIHMCLLLSPLIATLLNSYTQSTLVLPEFFSSMNTLQNFRDQKNCKLLSKYGLKFWQIHFSKKALTSKSQEFYQKQQELVTSVSVCYSTILLSCHVQY